MSGGRLEVPILSRKWLMVRGNLLHISLNPTTGAWNEVELLKKSQHENVIKYYDSFQDMNNGTLCIVMEFCDKGTLADFIPRVSL